MPFWSKTKELYRSARRQIASKNPTLEKKSQPENEKERPVLEEPRHARTKNLIYAEAAVKYAEEKLFLGSTNRRIDELHWRALSDKLGDSDVRAGLREEFVNDLAKNQPSGMSSGAASLWCADQAEAFGMGNCQSHSAVAFKYVLQHTDAREASILSVGDDHHLLVIGASPSELESARSERGTFRLDQPPRLPEQAVFCDPWYHEWFPASEWPNKIKSILRQTQVHNPKAMDGMEDDERAMWEAAGISLGPRGFSEHWREIDVTIGASKQEHTIAEYREYQHRCRDTVAPQMTNRATILAAAETRADGIIAAAAASVAKSNRPILDERPRSRCR
jgi:hypothetical protein